MSMLLTLTVAQANPVACFNSNMGKFCMELLERQAPKTVGNFLDYIDSGTYEQSFFHRSEPGFVIQGGGFKVASVNSEVRISAVSIFDPVVNEFGLSNTRGTVAMAKLGGDPDSATSQWFVNLADNSENLDIQNGGFTVFAKIIFDGITVFDAIEALQRVNFGGAFSSTPVINYDPGQSLKIENFVLIDDVELHDVTTAFNDNTLNFAVEIGNNSFFDDVRLKLIAVTPNITFELDATAVTPIPSKFANMATFSAEDLTLFIPSIMVNETTIARNVEMLLTDPVNFRFTLVRFD